MRYCLNKRRPFIMIQTYLWAQSWRNEWDPFIKASFLTTLGYYVCKWVTSNFLKITFLKYGHAYSKIRVPTDTIQAQNQTKPASFLETWKDKARNRIIACRAWSANLQILKLIKLGSGSNLTTLKLEKQVSLHFLISKPTLFCVKWLINSLS